MVIDVSRGAVVSIDLREQECLIECLDGRLWITKTGDGADYCLAAGDRCDLSGSGKVVIGAVASARIGISGTADFAVRVNEANWRSDHGLSGHNIPYHGRPSGRYNPLPGKCCWQVVRGDLPNVISAQAHERRLKLI